MLPGNQHDDAGQAGSAQPRAVHRSARYALPAAVNRQRGEEYAGLRVDNAPAAECGEISSRRPRPPTPVRAVAPVRAEQQRSKAVNAPTASARTTPPSPVRRAGRRTAGGSPGATMATDGADRGVPM